MRIIDLFESIDFTNAVNSIEKLIRAKNIEITSYEELVKFVASRKFLQAQRNDQRFISDVAQAVLRRLHAITEVRYDDSDDNYRDGDEFEELKVSEFIQEFFRKRGYQYLGEGRDQMAFLSPRNTVVKILGIGEDEREEIVRRYVAFFQRNQRNPYYPKIYNAGDFNLGEETYFIYEMEYLIYVANEEHVLEYLEDLMSSAARGEQAVRAYQKNRPLPKELHPDEIEGLLIATEQLIEAIGGYAPLDLSMIENLRRRESDHHIVIMDPFSL